MRVRAVPNVHRLTLALLAALALPAMAQESPAQADAPAKAVKTLDEVTVTGSRIKRVEIEQALPITSFTKAQIDAAGITSAEQLLQNLNVAGNGADNLASNAGIGFSAEDGRGNRGVSGANLRGQGADATLVLLNGRRVATHGLSARSVDLNSIPFAAIERVEVLRDGASAIYGTDAIGGVINFITKRDFRGAQLSALIDQTEAGGGNIQRGSLLFGHGDLDANGWNAFASLSFKRNSILRGSDRDFSNGNQPERGLVADTRGAPFATLVRPGSSGVGLTSILGTGPLDPSRPGENIPMTSISVLDLPGGAGCENGGPNMFPYDDRLWDFPGARYACAWDYPGAAVIQQPQDSTDFVGRATFRINDRHEAFAEITASKVEATNEYEPLQLTSSTSSASTALSPSTWYPLNDLTRATYDGIYNALAAYFGTGKLRYGSPIAYRWRCVACGPRQVITSTDAYRVLLGMNGLVGDWSYDVGLSRGVNKSESAIGTGHFYTDQLRTVLGSGLINPFLLPGQSQSTEGLAALAAASAQNIVLYSGRSIMTAFDASISGDLPWFRLPGGTIAMATGIDLRREEYRLDGDARADKRHIFQAPFDDANAVSNNSRDIKAAYVEFQLPVFKSLDINLAGRYDSYSGFGSTTNPKVSFKYRPAESLLFRGAYSTGFKVPSFTQLFRGISEQQYVGLDLADPETCPDGRANANVPGCEVIRPNELFGGNPDLRPETSTQKSFGLVYSPMQWFNISLDWWEIERENTIRAAPRDVLIQYYDLFKDNWIRDASGEVIAIDRRFINSGGSLSRGVEVDANFMSDLAGGQFRMNLNGSFMSLYRRKDLAVLPYSSNLVGEYVRYANLPLRWKHSLNASWTRGAWSHGISQIHRDGYYDELPISVDIGTYIPSQWKPRVEGYTTYNYNVTWTGIDKMKIGFGIKNLTDQDPPFTAHQNDFAAGAGWEPRVADPRGRAYTLLLEYSFW
jgi:iron complex outermembrane receptor protein